MKKRILIFLSLLLVALLAGCSAESKEKVETPKETTTVTEVDLKTAIPDPYDFFAEEDIAVLIDNEDSIYYQVKNYDEVKYTAYLEACKESGYTYVTCEIKTEESELYYAYDEDHQYYLQYGFGGEEKFIDIICDAVKEEEAGDNA